jgi:hypothetical protein
MFRYSGYEAGVTTVTPLRSELFSDACPSVMELRVSVSVSQKDVCVNMPLLKTFKLQTWQELVQANEIKFSCRFRYVIIK